MKSTKTLLTLILFSFTLLSCENEELQQENQQEYFHFTDLETNSIFSVSDINAIIPSPWNEIDIINDEISEGGFIPLLIQGNVEVLGEIYCLEFDVLLDPSNMFRNYTNPETVGGYSCGPPSGTSENTSLNFFINSLDLIAIGQVGEHIDINFSTSILLNGESEYREMNAELHIIRDQ